VAGARPGSCPALARPALALFAASWAAGCGSVPSRPTLLSDAGGRIDQVLMVVASPSRSALRNHELVQNVARALPPDARLLVLAHPDMILEPNPLPDRLRFLALPEQLALTIWPQDPFVVLAEGPDGGRLLAARDFERVPDREMAGIVAGALGWDVQRSALYFAGGNLLADETRAFVGADVVHENAVELGLSREAIVGRLAQELGRPIVVVGESPQPVEHLDMAFTPLGAGRLVLADARYGVALAQDALRTRPAEVDAFESETEAWFFGRPDLHSLPSVGGDALVRPTIRGGTRRAIAESAAMAAALDRIAADLAALGYEVLRVPFLAWSLGQDRSAPVHPGDTAYPVISYNNVLVERDGTTDRVYLPEYGFDTLDAAARRSWESAGFEVRAIRGVTTSAVYRGSLRCSVKVLARTPER
jgi:hypothetical protein